MKILEILTPKRLIGNLGERAAVKYLRKNKYKIIKRTELKNLLFFQLRSVCLYYHLKW